MDEIYTITFESGLRLVYQNVEETRPANIYIYVNTGSGNEDDSNRGISHFIEHLNFKGTGKRSAKQIFAELEDMGALANAATSNFRTYFYASCLPENIESTLEILADMTFNSKYDEKDIEMEKKVVFEEIDMYKDKPNSVLFEKMNEIFYKGTEFEHPVLGTRESLTKITRNDIVKYAKENYVPEKTVVSIVGHSTIEEIKNIVEKHVNSRFQGKIGQVEELNKSRFVIPNKKFDVIKKDVAQTLVALSFPAPNIYSDDKKVWILMSCMLGAIQSSRLFMKVREEYGLVYSIYSTVSLSKIGGDLTIYFGTNDKNAKKALALTKEVIDEAVKNGFTQEELDRVKAVNKGLILGSGETSSDLAYGNGSQLLNFGKIISKEEKLQELEKVTLEQVNEITRKAFDYANLCGVMLCKEPDATIFEIFD